MFAAKEGKAARGVMAERKVKQGPVMKAMEAM